MILRKSIAFFSLLVVLLVSCSKDEASNNEEKQVPVTYMNLKGSYFIKSIIEDTGAVVPYVNPCPTKIDSVGFYATLDYVQFFRCSTDECFRYEDGCNAYMATNNMLTNCTAFGGKVSSLTKTTLRIDYENVKASEFENHTNAKGVILQRF